MSNCQCQKCTWEAPKQITAEEARRKSEDINSMLASAVLQRVFSDISKATEKGLRGCQIDVTSEFESLLPLIIKHLKSLGYYAKQNSGFDQRDNYSWNSLDINW